jgi:hypothetical protein
LSNVGVAVGSQLHAVVRRGLCHRDARFCKSDPGFSSDLTMEHALECMVAIGIKAPRDLCARREPIEAVEGAGIHMQLGGDTRREQPLRLLPHDGPSVGYFPLVNLLRLN